jgi:hypothetical protein
LATRRELGSHGKIYADNEGLDDRITTIEDSRSVLGPLPTGAMSQEASLGARSIVLAVLRDEAEDILAGCEFFAYYKFVAEDAAAGVDATIEIWTGDDAATMTYLADVVNVLDAADNTGYRWARGTVLYDAGDATEVVRFDSFGQRVANPEAVAPTLWSAIASIELDFPSITAPPRIEVRLVNAIGASDSCRVGWTCVPFYLDSQDVDNGLGGAEQRYYGKTS